MKKIGLLLIIVIPCSSLATDQSPYVGEELRAIKSLSQQEIESLRNGEGLGFAKLAELNHFPGPIHVLEISGHLGLTSSQLAATTSHYEEMRVNAVALGEELLAAEFQLDQEFETESINAESLENALIEIGSLRAQLRYIHLESHLRQKNCLRLNKFRSMTRLADIKVKSMITLSIRMIKTNRPNQSPYWPVSAQKQPFA